MLGQLKTFLQPLKGNMDSIAKIKNDSRKTPNSTQQVKHVQEAV